MVSFLVDGYTYTKQAVNVLFRIQQVSFYKQEGIALVIEIYHDGPSEIL